MSLSNATLSEPDTENRIDRAEGLQDLFDDTSHRGLRGVEVTVTDDHVLLSGTVGSYYLKQMAQERVRQVCPKVKLCNRVVVQRHP